MSYHVIYCPDLRSCIPDPSQLDPNWLLWKACHNQYITCD